MLRIKHKNISMQFVTLVVLCMCFGLVMSLWLTSTHAAQPPQQPYYVVDTYQTPGTVYRIVNRKPGVFFRRRLGSISSIAIWGDKGDKLFFCSANDRRIYQRIGQREKVVFEHRTYIRDVAVDPNGNLYFSEASGAKSDGRIYKLSPPVNELEDDGRFSIATDSQSSPVQVRLSTVDGFWAGDFTFDAESNLYLSSGNRTPASIYRVLRVTEGQYGSPERRIYRDSRGAIKGIAMPNIHSKTRQDFIYYADWKQTIYKLNIRNSRRIRAFSGSIARSRNQHLSDIAFDIKSP